MPRIEMADWQHGKRISKEKRTLFSVVGILARPSGVANKGKASKTCLTEYRKTRREGGKVIIAILVTT